MGVAAAVITFHPGISSNTPFLLVAAAMGVGIAVSLSVRWYVLAVLLMLLAVVFLLMLAAYSHRVSMKGPAKLIGV